MSLKNIRWSEEKFLEEREKVLISWKTGQDVDLNEALQYHHTRPKEKYTSYHLAKAKKDKRTLVAFRGGVATVDGQIELLKYLEDQGADLLPVTIDSYTRNLQFEKAEKGIEESLKKGRSLLNGFPAVNYGVSGCRQIDRKVSKPITTKHGSVDGRLLAEITFAGGFTDFNGGGICFNVVYSKDVSLEKSLHDWQYIDRLIGYYADREIMLHREESGALTGTLMPPCISISVGIIEALLAAEQGVKNMCISYGQGGNLLQDVAAIRSLTNLGEEYLGKYGYDMVLTAKFDQWMGAFPQDESRAYGVICLGAATAALGGASQTIVKSPHEALGIPTKEANAAGIKATRQVVNMLHGQCYTDSAALKFEIDIIRREVTSILEKVMDLGDGDIAVGVVRAFKCGVLDIPFAPSLRNMGLAMPIRDNEGCIRFFDHGNLPFDKELINFHKTKVAKRKDRLGTKPNYELLINDIYSVSNGSCLY